MSNLWTAYYLYSLQHTFCSLEARSVQKFNVDSGAVSGGGLNSSSCFVACFKA